MTKREREEADASARFDRVMALFKNAWAEEYPSEPFEVDGVVTPKAMQFINGYSAGLAAKPASDEALLARRYSTIAAAIRARITPKGQS